MAQRNMLCNHQLHDLEIEQGLTHLHPEPCILASNIIDFPNQSMHPSLPASVNAPSLDNRHLSDHDSSSFYGNQYNALQQCHHPLANLELGGAGPSNLSYSHYIVPSSSYRMCPIASNHGSSDNMGSSSNHGILGVGVEGYGRDNHFMDHLRGSSKRKNSEGVLENSYHANGLSGSSSSLGIPLTTRVQQWEEPFEAGVSVLDAPVFAAPEYRVNEPMSIIEASQRSVRSRSSATGLPVEPTGVSHHHNQMLQGNYMSQSFQPASNAWVEQFGSNGSDMGSSSWSHAPSTPYFSGRSISRGPFEVGSTSGQGYQDTLPGRTSMNLLHPSSMHQHHHHPPPMQAMQGGPGYSYHPQLLMSSYRQPMYGNMHHGAMNPSRDVLESGSRYPRTFPSTGHRIYRSHRRASQTADEVNGRMRALSSEDVAMLEFSGFHGVDNMADQHRDMRLDIDDMSYEELLALQERIGVVNTGLSEESILKYLKMKTYASHAAPIHHSMTGVMQDSETCIICQVEYKDGETIGILDCRHDYHADCIKQWLMVKNLCPICKTSALSMDMKE